MLSVVDVHQKNKLPQNADFERQHLSHSVFVLAVIFDRVRDLNPPRPLREHLDSLDRLGRLLRHIADR